jgi:DNA-binding transcriptional LysR family regulator
MGISLLDDLNVAEVVSSEKLVRVLPGWRAQEHAIYLVHPAQRFSSPKLKAFIETTTRIIKGAGSSS